MSQSSITQQQLKGGKLTFIDFHRPAIEAGTYKLRAQQKINSPDGDAQTTAVAETTFVVDSPRFSLPGGEIHAHYPPLGGNADYDGVVPSISFNQATLPWSRSPDQANNTPDGASWLALLLVDGQDVKEGRAREVFKQVDSNEKLPLKDVEAQLGIAHLQDWKRYDAEMPVNVLELKDDFYHSLIPSYGELQWLSHTRKSTNQKGEDNGELTYVLGNRMPSPNQTNTVYLVSLEHRYANTQADTKPRLMPSVNGYQRLVYLHKWEFICKPGIMYNYVVTEDILQRIKDIKPDIQLPETLPSWLGQEFEGVLGREELRDLLLNTHEVHQVTEEARNYILSQIEKVENGERIYQVTPKVLREAETLYEAKIPLAAKIGNVYTQDTAVRPAWLKHKFKGEEGKAALSDLLDGKALVTGINKPAANWIIQKAKKAGGTFDGLLDAVEAGSFHERPRPGRPIKNEVARKMLASGRTVLRHHLRSGGKTFSWYKGPLSANREEDRGFPFPVSASDALLIFNQATGMFDTSYATAWNLGRMKGLENKAVATSLYQWRHEQRHVLMKEQNGLNHDHLHLVPPLSAELPEDVMRKIDAWKLLQDIPFNYLVPKASLLPEESLRFFHLDANWVRALLDGFFSVGKVHGLDDRGEEYEHFPSFDRPITGILLRSDAVAGWPSMHIDAHAQRMEGTDVDIDPRHQIPVLRKVPLDNEVLLMLFDGIPKTIDIYLSPEALHSGFTPHMTDESEEVTYVHPITNPDTGKDIYDENEEAVTIAAITAEEQNEYRIFSPTQVKNRMQASIRARVPGHENFEIGPGHFGLEMIEGTPMVRFQLEEMEEKLVMDEPLVVATSAPAAAPITNSNTGRRDDLTRITGIGPKSEEALNKANILSFEDLANATVASLNEALAADNLARTARQSWIDQARNLI